MRGSALCVVAGSSLLGLGCGTSQGPAASVAAGEDTPTTSCPALRTPRTFVKGGGVDAKDAELRLNHLQAKGTHDSYHFMLKNPVSGWEYDHVPLADQLERQGVRGVELDLQWDSECARFRLFHVGILDEETTCAFFTNCLVALRGWSEAHPGHHPNFVQLEAKNGFTSTALVALREGCSPADVHAPRHRRSEQARAPKG